MIGTFRNLLETLTRRPQLIRMSEPKTSRIEHQMPPWDEAIALFRANPDQYFFVDGASVDWDNLLRPGLGGELFAGYMLVKVHGRTLGFVARNSSHDRGLSFEIGHFAVQPECVGTGVATIMANILKTKLRRHYKTETIIFHEEHTRFSERNYVQFFTKLGATNPDPNVPRRWVWDISQTPVE